MKRWKRYSILDRIIYRLTARRWNKFILHVLFRHCGRGEWQAGLSSEQLHILAAEFDPTQKARWTAITDDGHLVFREDVHLDRRATTERISG